MVAWNLWTNVPTVKLWEAVALVLEIEPTSLRWPSPHYAYERLPFRARGFSSQAECDDFDKAMNFVERATSAAGPIQIRGPMQSGMSKWMVDVALADVVAFFEKCGWPVLPEPLVKVGQVFMPAPAPSSDELGTRERSSLLKIIYGMAVASPYQFDPEAKRSEVAVTIASACAAAGCQVDEDTVRKYLREAAQQYGASRR